MPSIATIVINDGATTPVAHTFTSIGQDDKGVLWLEQTTPVPANGLVGKRIGLSLIRPVTSASLKSTSAKGVVSIYVPVPEVLGNSSTGITPPATKAYELASRSVFDMPMRSTAQEKKDLRVLTANALAHASVIALLETLSKPF